MSKLRVCVIGGGSWGTTVASLLARNTEAVLYARNAQVVDEINTHNSNETYLPGARLPRRLSASADLQATVAAADVLVMGVPSQAFRAVLEELEPSLRPGIPIVSLSKGLERGTDLRMSELIHEVTPGHPVAVLTGPNLSAEIMAGQAAASVLAMEDSVIVKQLQGIFRNGLFRVYTNDDVVGCELGGVLKNIIAIAVGMGIGLGAGDNTRAALITRGLAEISRLGVALGGRPETFSGLAGMGDLIATCVSPKSRNHHVGVELGHGKKIDDIINDMHTVAEGVKSAPTVVALAEKTSVEMPIASDVYDVIRGAKTPQDAFRGLLRASVGAESEPG